MSSKRKVYQILASKAQARINCQEAEDTEWQDRHEEAMLELVEDTAPSGSGFDCGTQIDIDKSTGEKLVFTTSFHHMDEGGSYDGWTEVEIVVSPSLVYGFTLEVIGQDRDDVHDYIGDVFHAWLDSEAEA